MRKGRFSEETKRIIGLLRIKNAALNEDKIFSATSNTLTIKVNRALKKLGYSYTSHDFRHTKLTEFADGGMSISAV